MQTPEPTSLTVAQQQRAEALRIVRQLFTLPTGFTGLGRERLPMEAANPVIALAEWILEERPQPTLEPVVVGEPAVPGSRERPLAYTDEVWTVDTALSANTTEAALRRWDVTPNGAFFEQRPAEDLPEAETPDNAVQADLSEDDVTEEAPRG